MLDKCALEDADSAMLTATALECSRQQQQMFSKDNCFDEDWLAEFQRFEELRSFALHQIDWQGVDIQQQKESLRQLQALDLEIRQQLERGRDELASRLHQLKKKRSISSEYLSFQTSTNDN